MKKKKGITVGQLRECLAKVDENVKVRLNGFTCGSDLVDIKRYEVGFDDVLFLKSADAPYDENGERIVFYDYKLLTSIAYITRYWDDVGKQRYLDFMRSKMDEDDYKWLEGRVERYDDPFTLHLIQLDEMNLSLTLEFFISNERDLGDRFGQFTVDDGK